MSSCEDSKQTKKVKTKAEDCSVEARLFADALWDFVQAKKTGFL